MIRGTRFLMGLEAKQFRSVTNALIEFIEEQGYSEIIPSALAEQELFAQKGGEEILQQMYTFNDKGNRGICLIPEVTAIVQSLYKTAWEKTMPKPIKVWYLTRCYRYERPQQGRYREFWQFGVECLGDKTTKEEMIDLLVGAIKKVEVTDFVVSESVKRGLSYYIEDGFEVSVPSLGAQKQIAGGGRYEGGIGWAIGVDRLLLSKTDT